MVTGKHAVQFILAALLYCSSPNAAAQQGDSVAAKKLHEMGFYPFPAAGELSNNLFADSLIRSAAISSADVNETFSNNRDLQWLNEIGRRNKVILLGEEHYHQYVSNIRNRILFYLNTVDRYPIVIMEAQYSYTEYFNYYLDLADDAAARKYFSDVLHAMVINEDTRDLLDHLRAWNMAYPSKKIAVGFSDIEHDYRTTIKKILLPYFKKINRNLDIDTRDLSMKELGVLMPKLQALLAIAKRTAVVGDYPFLTPQYIGSIIENLESTYKAYSYEFTYYRQKAIIRHLTEGKYFGEYLQNGKVLLYGGNYHMTTHYRYPDRANFFREGSYLSEEYAPTFGKVYSIDVHSFSRSLGTMAGVDVDSTLHQSDNYVMLVRHWQEAFNARLITENDVLFDFRMNDLHRLILRASHACGDQPVVITSIDWMSILKIAAAADPVLSADLENWAEDYGRYDAHIFIPQSPFIVARNKSQLQKN
jgi:hypothetical protein